MARRLGWLDLPERERIGGDIARTVAELSADGANRMVLLGMGGSSLAPRVLRQTLGNPSDRELVVLDTTDPDQVASALDELSPADLAVVAVSKSGTTTETTSLLEILWHRVDAALGEGTGRRFVVVTEPGTPLASLAHERGFLAALPHPVDVGGRYSALSVVGLLPATWLGHDVDQLLEAGAAGLTALDGEHPAVQIAATVAAAAQDGWARLALCGSARLGALGAWAEQLVAESTGKQGRGVLPVVWDGSPEALGPWPVTVYLSPRFHGEDTSALDAALEEVAVSRLSGRSDGRSGQRRSVRHSRFSSLPPPSSDSCWTSTPSTSLTSSAPRNGHVPRCTPGRPKVSRRPRILVVPCSRILAPRSP